MERCALETMKKIRFGVEIELAGGTDDPRVNLPDRIGAARVVQQAVGGSRNGSRVVARDERSWLVAYDASIEDCGGFELVTPICDYYDIPIIQHVLEQLVRAGAYESDLCGIHVHIDGSLFDAEAVTRLVKICHQQEEFIVSALGPEAMRRALSGGYCKPTQTELIEKLVERKPRSLPDLRECWYEDKPNWRASNRYDDSRYRGVNIHSLFYRGTIEFRWFPTTTNASRLKTYIQLCLALGAKALNGRHTRAAKRAMTATTNARYAVRTLLVRLGLNGPEFRSLRRHLLEGLPGDISYARDYANDNQRVSA